MLDIGEYLNPDVSDSFKKCKKNTILETKPSFKTTLLFKNKILNKFAIFRRNINHQ